MESNFNKTAGLDLELFLKKDRTAYVSWELWEIFHCKKRCVQNLVNRFILDVWRYYECVSGSYSTVYLWTTASENRIRAQAYVGPYQTSMVEFFTK